MPRSDGISLKGASGMAETEQEQLFGTPIGERLRLAREEKGLKLEDIGLVELNEAFAAQVLACLKELPIDPERLNVNGGAIALGHPLGMSGARIAADVALELKRRGGRYGLATMCVGVGQGVAMALEAVT